MTDTRIDQLLDHLKQTPDIKKFLETANIASVNPNRLYINVTSSVKIIIETGLSPFYDVWIENSNEGEGCTVAKTTDMQKVADFCVSVFKLCGGIADAIC